MFNGIDWLSDGHAICILFDEPGTPIILFRTTELARQHAAGADLKPGSDFLIIGGFSDTIQSLTFANSGEIQRIHSIMWER